LFLSTMLLGVPGFRFTMFACRQIKAILLWGYLRDALKKFYFFPVDPGLR
jgi:hypothetical protein